VVDSVIDFDSLWDRVKKKIDTDNIEDSDQFRQHMIEKFFKEKWNPKGTTPGHEALISEIWSRGTDEERFPKVVEIQQKEVEKRKYENMIDGEKWKERFSDLIGEGKTPKEAYDLVMQEKAEEDRKRKEEEEKKIKEDAKIASDAADEITRAFKEAKKQKEELAKLNEELRKAKEKEEAIKRAFEGVVNAEEA
jgi:hypothetical protein